MTIGIYGIFDAKTEECLYIGLSKNIEKRWEAHKNSLRAQRHIRNDFNQWFKNHNLDFNSMEFKILEECIDDYDKLNLAEIKWFTELKPLFYGKAPSKNEKWGLSDETKDKISKINIAFIKSAKENGTYVSSWDNMTDEAKAVMSTKNKEHGFNSITGSEAARKGNIGRKKSYEQRKKLSDIMKAASKIIETCLICEMDFKGKAALGRHMKKHLG